MSRNLKLGSRGSPLAMWQANWAKAGLESIFEDLAVELVILKTTGDTILNVPLAQIGGKGLFTKELDEALLDGRIDFAVHSMKDLPFDLPDGIQLVAITEREDHRDAFVSDGRKLGEMPSGARIGTSSLRRQVQLRHRFPDLHVVPVRGNVDTRLRKLDAGEYDGIVLAAAGLNRLGHSDRITEFLESEVMLSAVGQGALAIVCRAGDGETQASLLRLDHETTRCAVLAERALLASLEGSCQVPIGGHARIEGNVIFLTGLIASLDGGHLITDRVSGETARAGEIGAELGRRLLSSGGAAVLEEISRNGT